MLDRSCETTICRFLLAKDSQHEEFRLTTAGLQVLLDRLAAQELMLLQRPVVSGRYSGSPFVNMLLGPLDEALRSLFAQLVQLGELVCSTLSEEPDAHESQLAEIESTIQKLEAQR